MGHLPSELARYWLQFYCKAESVAYEDCNSGADTQANSCVTLEGTLIYYFND